MHGSDEKATALLPFGSWKCLRNTQILHGDMQTDDYEQISTPTFNKLK